MHHVLAVAVSHACSDAPHDVPSLVLGQDAAGVDVVEQVAVLGHLQHEVDLSRCLHHAKHSEDAGVVETADHGHLSRQELGENLARGAAFVQHLDGDLQRERERDRERERES